MKKFNYICFCWLILTGAVVSGANAQTTDRGDTVKVTYKKDMIFVEPHHNLELADYPLLTRETTFENGEVVTEYARYEYDLLFFISKSCKLELRGSQRPIYGKNEIRSGAKVFWHGNTSENDYSTARTSWQKTEGTSNGVIYSKVGVPDLSKVEIGEPIVRRSGSSGSPTMKDGILGQWDTYWHYLYRRNGEPIFFDSSDPIPGWYGINDWLSGTVRVEYCRDSFRTYKTSFDMGDMFIYTDGQLFDFIAFQRTCDFDLRIQDTTTEEGYPAKVVTFECRSKYLGHDFYTAVVDTIYQLP